MKICIAGKNQIAVKALKYLIKMVGKEDLVVCANQSDNGISGWQPSLRRYAAELGIRIESLQDLYDYKSLIFISLEFDKIVNPCRFNSSKLYNIHFSALPAYKGMYTSAWPILNGELSSGATLHEIDHGIDTGKIIDKINFAIDEAETARSLYYKYLDYGYSIFVNNLDKLLSGEYSKMPQPAEMSTYYSRSSINYNNLQIDTRKTASEISKQIRAFTFLEYQVPVIDGIPVGKFIVTDERSLTRPGTLTSLGDNTFKLSTVDYSIIFERNYELEFLDAIEKLNFQKIYALLDKGVDPDLTGRSGWTPLMIAAYNGRMDLCKALLERKADPNARNQNGTTVLMYAKDASERSGDFSICDLLIKNGADPSLQDEFGMTVLMHAKKNGQIASSSYFFNC